VCVEVCVGVRRSLASLGKVSKCVCLCVFPPESVLMDFNRKPHTCLKCGGAIEPALPEPHIPNDLCRECEKATLQLQYRELSRYISSRLGFKDRQPHILNSIVDFYQHRLL